MVTHQEKCNYVMRTLLYCYEGDIALLKKLHWCNLALTQGLSRIKHSSDYGKKMTPLGSLHLTIREE